MRFGLFNANWQLSTKIAVGASFSTAVLSVVVLIQSVALANQRERVILVPPVIDQKYQIGMDAANTEYYQSIAYVVSGIIGTTTNRTLTSNIKTLRQFFAPALQPQLEESLNALVNKLPKDNFNSWFIPKDSFYEKATGKIFIRGVLQSAVVSSRIQEQPLIYEYRIIMQAGKPSIVHFNSYEGTKPLTLAQIRTNALAQQNNPQKQNAQANQR